MTPQETGLVDELFDRLAKLETVSRDPDAERLIAEGARRAPHALYALVQTALIQDEALRRANAHLEALQAQGVAEPPRSFLDSLRDAAFGHNAPRGSVPSVGSPRAAPFGDPAQAESPPRPGPDYPQAPYPQQAPYPPGPGFPPGPAFGSGGSFLGNAASAAAGVTGGALLLDGIRSMFGHHSGFAGAGRDAFGHLGGETSPWGGSAADSDLAREAGIDHIGRGGDAGNNRSGGAAGVADDQISDDKVSDNQIADDRDDDDTDFANEDDGDLDGDDGGSGGDDIDFA